jgi:general secretion pathway protein K
MRFRFPGTRSERGLALVSVLWGVSILALISSAMLSASRMGAHLEAGAWRAAQGDAIAEAAINRTILALMDQRGDRAPPVDGTAETVAFGATQVRVSVQDEAGKIDLNFADADTFRSLLAQAGVEDDDASTLADAIVAWRAPDPAHPPASPIVFRTVADVQSVPHMTRAIFARIAPLVTVYSKSASVDTNVAPRAVLLALPGMDADKVDDLLKGRAAMRAMSGAGAPAIGPGHAFTIAAALRRGNVRTVRRAVVQFTGDQTKPYWFLAWD